MQQSFPEPNEQFEMDKCKKEESNKDEGPIENLRREPIGYSVLKILAALCPLVFLVLAVLAAQLDGKLVIYSPDGMPDASSYDQKLLNVVKVVPTAYPMVFSMLVAGALRSVALYLSERGTTLGRLEQLIGSSTVGSSIMIHARLQMLDVVGLLVVLLWALSPAGGQSALRMVNIQKMTTSSKPATLWYASSDSALNILDGSRTLETLLYTSVLLSLETARNASRDIYGNIRIPTIENLEQAGHAKDHEGWIDIDQKKNVEYSGLLGVPTAGLVPGNSSYNFSMETHYFVFQCVIDPPVTPINSSKFEDLGPQRIPFYFDTVPADLVRDEAPNFDYDATPRTIQFVSVSAMPDNTSIVLNTPEDPLNTPEEPLDTTWSSCRVTTSYVETHNKCEGTKCQVSAIRRSNLAHISSNRTHLDMYRNPSLIGEFSTISGNETGMFGISTLTERYIYDPNNLQWENWTLSLQKVPPAILSTRLSLLFNTYWRCLKAQDITISGVKGNLSTLVPPPDKLFLDPDSGEPYIHGMVAYPKNDDALFLARRAETTVFYHDNLYQLNWIYFTVYVASATVLLIVACAGAGIQLLVLVPDILGYVSSLTRDNPYAETMPVAATLDGLDRALQLKNQRVKIADVRPGEDVGHISFISSTWVGSAHLERGRSYL